MAKSAIRIIISRIIGSLVFLILLGIALIIAKFMPEGTYSDIVSFFYDNIKIIIIMFALGTLSEIFWNLSFPFNFIAPIASAFLTKYVLIFVYSLIEIMNITFFYSKYSLEVLVYWICAIVLIGGYLIIFIRNGKEEKGTNEKISDEGSVKYRRKEEKKKKK